jgi:hypothetical protein
VRKAPLFAVVVLGVAALLRPAFAYTDSGDRIFPANIQLPQIAPGDEFYLNYTTLPLNPGATGGQTRATDVTGTYGKMITDSLGVFIEMTYTGINQAGTSTLYGWQNVDGELKYEAINDPTHEFLFSLGLDRETGGTGAERVGAFASGATTPRAYFGKGFGDLDIGFLRPLAIEGMFGSAFADAAPRPDLATTGFVVEYSIPYMQSKVQSFDLPDWVRGMTPITEIVWTAPEGSSYGTRPTELVAPGITYAGAGWELGVEALVPCSRATGRGIGVTAQLHIALDYLFSDTVGKPLFSER